VHRSTVVSKMPGSCRGQFEEEKRTKEALIHSFQATAQHHGGAFMPNSPRSTQRFERDGDGHGWQVLEGYPTQLMGEMDTIRSGYVHMTP
jgi:hypothetical protein